MSNDLTPIHIYILLHLKRAKVDYAKMMAKLSHVDLDLINSCIDDLIKAGLVERDSGSAIKRSKAKFKKAFEVRKHHTYYRLTKVGEQFVRKMDRRWFREYFETLIGRKAFEIVKMLKDRKDFHSACRELGLDPKYYDEFLLFKLITPKGKRTKLLELLTAFAEI